MKIISNEFSLLETFIFRQERVLNDTNRVRNPTGEVLRWETM